MIKRSSFLVFCLMSALVLPAAAAENTDLFQRPVIRERFHASIESGSAVGALVKELDERMKKTPDEMPDHVFAYYAALRGLQAKHEKHLIKKLKYLKESLTLLDEAVERAPDDLEVRFVRFSSLHHFPNLLGIGKKRGQDVSSIVMELKKQNYSLVDSGTQEEMMHSLLKSDRLSKEQTMAINQLQGQRP